MHIFSAINEVAVFGTACLMMAVHVLWHWSLHVGDHDETTTQKQPTLTIGITFLNYAVLLTFVAYALSFASALKMGTFHISSLIALFAVTVQVSTLNSDDSSFFRRMGDIGFIVVCIIGGAFVLQYWPW